jgi:transcriptional regulator with XRE-family HTH domain
VSAQLGARFREERERRGWTRQNIVNAFERRGLYVHITTITKIEAGNRAITIEELAAYADIYGVSMDALAGRATRSDFAWTISKLSSNAQRAARDVAAIADRVNGDLGDLVCCNPSSGEQLEGVVTAAETAHATLLTAYQDLTALSNEFPLGGLGIKQEAR